MGHLSAAQSYNKQIIYEYSNKLFTNLTVSYYQKLKSNLDNNISNLFNYKENARWYIRTKKAFTDFSPKNPSIEISFNENVYVSEVKISLCKGERNYLPIELSIEKSISSSNMWDLRSFHKILKDHNSININFIIKEDKMHLDDMFPTKKIMIDIVKTKTLQEPICFSGIDIVLQKELNYTPVLTFKDLKADIIKNSNYLLEQKKWQFKHDFSEVMQQRNDHYFRELTYYALHGNIEAQKMFFTCNPFGEQGESDMGDIYIPLMKNVIGNKGIKR